MLFLHSKHALGIEKTLYTHTLIGEGNEVFTIAQGRFVNSMTCELCNLCKLEKYSISSVISEYNLGVDED